MRPPTLEQLLVLADRAEHKGGLTAAEAARLREGIVHLADRRAGPVGSGGAQLNRLRHRLAALHRPLVRGGVEVCRECSGWDGLRCRGLVTPWPCPTAEAASRPLGGRVTPVAVPGAAREPGIRQKSAGGHGSPRGGSGAPAERSAPSGRSGSTGGDPRSPSTAQNAASRCPGAFAGPEQPPTLGTPTRAATTPIRQENPT